jgi:hypothetical protein
MKHTFLMPPQRCFSFFFFSIVSLLPSSSQWSPLLCLSCFCYTWYCLQLRQGSPRDVRFTAAPHEMNCAMKSDGLDREVAPVWVEQCLVFELHTPKPHIRNLILGRAMLTDFILQADAERGIQIRNRVRTLPSTPFEYAIYTVTCVGDYRQGLDW